MQVNKKGPHKFKELRSVSESYAEYEENYPKSKLDKKTYLKIVITYFEESLKYMLEGGEARFPFLGILYVKKHKRDLNKLRINWKATHELWDSDPEAKEKKTLVHHLNEHTSGFYYRFHWVKGKIKNISAYSFMPVRSAKQLLSKSITELNMDYLT